MGQVDLREIITTSVTAVALDIALRTICSVSIARTFRVEKGRGVLESAILRPPPQMSVRIGLTQFRRPFRRPS